MLITKELVKKSIKHFPKWMDIRKRHFSSIGGKLLSSVAREVAEVQDSIDEYIKQHFIPFYEDKCEVIPDFIYKANIGNVDIEKITLVEPNLEIITDIKTFYERDNVAYYQDGFIFIKEKMDYIFYMLDGYKNEAQLEKMHVWNTYDEFAAFVGIERYQDESNYELFNRIINVSKNVLNSSEEGIKNAITSSLINIIPELSAEDIKLERPTAENLVKYYDEFNTILDTLADVNKDILKNKKWDIDKWSNDFKKIDYIPHTWDIILKEMTNGIGDNDDLKPIFIDATNTTDIDISFYEKSEEHIDSFIRDKEIDDTLNLSLIKYNNMLNPYTAKYSITASEAEEIEYEVSGMGQISVDLYETLKGKHTRSIEELVIDSSNLKDIEIIKEGLLEEGKFYRIKFTPKSKYDTMEITNCLVVNEYGSVITDSDGNLLSYKDPKDNFILDGNTLVNKLVKKSITRLDEFNVHKNAIDIGSGIAIDKINEESELILNTIGCSGESVKIFYDSELSKVPDNDIQLNNFFYDEERKVYVPDVTGDTKSITVNIRANQFSTTVAQGQCVVTALINGQPLELTKEYINGELVYSTPRFNEPQQMLIEIAAMFNNNVEISKLMYSNYTIKFYTEEGELIQNSDEDNLYWMPQGYENKLFIRMRTRTQYSPILRRVFIGTPIDNNEFYETDLITGMENAYLKINSNCNVELYESSKPFAKCDKYSSEQTVTRGYSTDKIYRATSNEAYIILNTAEYFNIDSIDIEEGTYEVTGEGIMQRHILKLRNGQGVSSLTITGHYNSLVASKSIYELIKHENIAYEPYVIDEDGEWISGYKLYANKLLKCFVIENNNLEQSMVKISYDSFDLGSDRTISEAVVNGLPDSLQASFSSIDGDNGYITIGDTHSGTFTNFYIYPKYAKEYIARNEYTTYAHHREGIEIVNTFNNGYEDGKLMVYEVNSISNEEYDVTFDNGKSWSIGKIGLTIDLHKDKNYNMIQKMITEKIKLGSTIELKDIYTAENKELVELDQYIIDTTDKDYEVVYKYDINNTAYDKAEFITVKNDGFNKLRYSNVYEIKYLGKEVFDETEDIIEQIDEEAYELDKEKGIIVWKDKELINSGTKLYIIYSIKKAIAIKFNIDSLYKKIQYPINAYKKINSYRLDNIEDGRKINLLNPLIGDIELSNKIANDYKKSSAVYVNCRQVGFAAEKTDNLLVIKKIAKINSLAVKSGWYYLLGREYYMFATDQSQNIIEDEYATSQEVNKLDNELLLHKKTSNYIKNSKMILGSLANSHNIFDFEDIKTLRGSSTINSITACDSYNYWQTFAMDLNLTDGLNGLGLLFKPHDRLNVGYALLDITKYISDKTHISFYNPDNLSVYIGKEKLIKDLSLTDTISIGSMSEITDKDIDNIYYSTFNKEENHKYYLIVMGQGRLDDIIVQDGDVLNLDLHKKNISNLNLNLYEATTSGVVSRIILNQEKGNKNNGAEINSTGYIVNASNIDWNITKIKSYTTEKDWLSGWDLENVNVTRINDKDCALVTEGALGKIVTRPIYVGDPNTISSIIFKINNVPIKSMQGFNAQLLQAQISNGAYMPCKQKLNNSSALNYTKDLMYPYIKLSVDIQKNKVIDNIEIYIEYKSSDQYAPAERIEANGQFLTKVFDSHYTSTYKLKSIEIEDKDGAVDLFIRAAKEKSGLSVWTDWYPIQIKDKEIMNDIEFEDYRFFQMKVLLGEKDSKIKIKHFDLEVMK